MKGLLERPTSSKESLTKRGRNWNKKPSVHECVCVKVCVRECVCVNEFVFVRVCVCRKCEHHECR